MSCVRSDAEATRKLSSACAHPGPPNSFSFTPKARSLVGVLCKALRTRPWKRAPAAVVHEASSMILTTRCAGLAGTGITATGTAESGRTRCAAYVSGQTSQKVYQPRVERRTGGRRTIMAMAGADPTPAGQRPTSFDRMASRGCAPTQVTF